MLSTQPFYIAGIEDADEAKASAFGASGIFAFVFLASMAGIWYDNQNKSAESEIESDTGADVVGGYQLARDNNFPSYGATPSS